MSICPLEQIDSGVQETGLPGVSVITPRLFPDGRGSFMESYSRRRYTEYGISHDFVQDNISRSTSGVLRGLHYQLKKPQAKLIAVMEGEILDVAVDIRKGSPSFGKWTGVVLSAENHKQIYIPEGFAHGFSVLSNNATVMYKCSDFYTPGDEYSLLFSDSEVGIDWMVTNPLLSEKDASAPLLAEINADNLPVF